MIDLDFVPNWDEIRRYIKNPRLVSQSVMMTPPAAPGEARVRILEQYSNQRAFIVGVFAFAIDTTTPHTDVTTIFRLEDNRQTFTPGVQSIGPAGSLNALVVWAAPVSNLTTGIPLKLRVDYPCRAGSTLEIVAQKTSADSITLAVTVLAAVGLSEV